jgi:hypothetical protein
MKRKATDAPTIEDPDATLEEALALKEAHELDAAVAMLRTLYKTPCEPAARYELAVLAMQVTFTDHPHAVCFHNTQLTLNCAVPLPCCKNTHLLTATRQRTLQLACSMPPPC